VRRLVLGLVLFVVALVAGAAGFVGWRLRASLPALDGERALPGLSAPVTVERDELGVPTLGGTNRLDLVRATGFLHAQDRFFQMDLLRRAAAGELAALFGPAALDRDRTARVHRFRARAIEQLRAATATTRAALDAYAAGVGAGLAALGAAPPEYLLLRQDPVPWTPEDSYLVVMAMFLDLQDGTCARESARGVLFDALPAKLAAFVAAAGTEWDAPIVGAPIETPPIPEPDVQEATAPPARAASANAAPEAEFVKGSNSWAISGAHTIHGGALLANDMHLGLSLPNIWYRMVIELPGTDARRLAGVTLPGTPAVIAGSNGRVAWGFTNSYADWCDLVVLEPEGTDPEVYLTAEGPRRLEHHEERIVVKGGEDSTLDVAETIWGPVIDRDHGDRWRALRWVAHESGATDLGLLRLEAASTVEEALDVTAEAGIPGQNVVVADRSGSIGWTIAGRIPRRSAAPPSVPVSWHDAGAWDGWLDAGEHPRVVNPPIGRIWTANNRVVDADRVAVVGDGGFDLGARARQIRDDLLAIERATEIDLLAVQLDDRALFLERWRGLLLDLLTPAALEASTQRAELRDVVEAGWTGRASVDSAGYRIVRAFRFTVAERVLGALTAPAKAADDRFSYARVTAHLEGPLWRLVTERPAHLLDPAFPSWDAWLLAAADAMVESLLDAPGKTLAERTWGERNTVRIRHPLSLGVPALAKWLDLPAEQLPGDFSVPRVQGARFGASERMVVSPGREETGIFHMPGGQSGHPLSPFYRAGHGAWAEGEATSFLPGLAEHRLTLVP